MNFAENVDAIIDAFKKEPRNKVFVDFETLRLSATEETGSNVSEDTLKMVIKSHLDGEYDGDQQLIYDGATYACGVVARCCFGEDPDEDVDYEVKWIVEDDGSFAAQVMLT